jgi:hypothetical protein
MGALILDSLLMDNFRAFDHLAIDRLGQVNLIVGRNSVGKTCLLEGLAVYANRASPNILEEILESRNEVTRMSYNARYESDESVVHTLRYLFNGWMTLDEHRQGYKFSIGPVQPELNRLTVEIGWYIRQIDSESETRTWKPVTLKIRYSSLRYSSHSEH